MSNFSVSKESVFPEDMEDIIAKAQETISVLEGKIVSVNSEIKTKISDLDVLNTQILEANSNLNKIKSDYDSIKESMEAREAKISQREVALSVEENFIKEREEKIHRYIDLFTSMRNRLIK